MKPFSKTQVKLEVFVLIEIETEFGIERVIIHCIQTGSRIRCIRGQRIIIAIIELIQTQSGIDTKPVAQTERFAQIRTDADFRNISQLNIVQQNITVLSMRKSGLSNGIATKLYSCFRF